LADSSALKDEPSLKPEVAPKRLFGFSCAEAAAEAAGVSSVISASGDACVSKAGFAGAPKTLPVEGAGAPNAVEGWPKVLLGLPPNDDPRTLDPLLSEANPDELDALPPNKPPGPVLAGAAVAKGLAVEALPPKGLAVLAAGAPNGD